MRTISRHSSRRRCLGSGSPCRPRARRDVAARRSSPRSRSGSGPRCPSGSLRSNAGSCRWHRELDRGPLRTFGSSHSRSHPRLAPRSRLPIGAGLFAGVGYPVQEPPARLPSSCDARRAFAPKPRGHARTAGPWLGPWSRLRRCPRVPGMFVWERRQGFPAPVPSPRSRRRRGQGFSLPKRWGRSAGGQLLYVTPPFLVAGYRVLPRLAANRVRDADGLGCSMWADGDAPGAPLMITNACGRASPGRTGWRFGVSRARVRRRPGPALEGPQPYAGHVCARRGGRGAARPDS